MAKSFSFNPFTGNFDLISQVTLAAVGSSPNANAASISSTQVLTLEPADGSNPGIMTAIAQTVGGIKTFNSVIYAAGGVDVATTGGTDTLTIGGTGADVINIGHSGATINIQGTTLYENVTQLQVTDPLITINKGGGTGSGGNSGIEIEENSAITGYAETSADRNSWTLKAPNTAGIATLTPGASGITLNQSSHDPVTLTAVGSSPNANGASLSSQALTLQPADGTHPGVLTSGTQTIGGAKTFSGNVVMSGSVTLTNEPAGPLKTSSGIVTNDFIDLTNTTTDITGILAVANGGTGRSSLNQHAVLTGNGVAGINSVSPGTSGNVLTSNGTDWVSSTPAAFVAPTIQKFTSGSGTYTLPTSPRSPLYIEVEMVGGGGGGQGANNSGGGTVGSAGGNTTFGSSLLTANGGAGGAGAIANGGSASITTSATVINIVALSGAGGSGPPGFSGSTGVFAEGVAGASTAFSGGGAGGGNNQDGESAPSNSGAGGGGAGSPTSNHTSGSSGAAGGYLRALITSPSATYSYAVGASGGGGSDTKNGGAGGAGVIIVTEHYQ